MKIFNHFGVIGMFIFFFHTFAMSQTLVSGNVSGVWDFSSSPYYIIDNCTVPGGSTLYIEPGVRVVIGENLTITVNGLIFATGTEENRITFTSPNDSIYWNQIALVNTASDTSEFIYCNFEQANIGLALKIEGRTNATMITKVSNCFFSNCITAGIYGYARGVSFYSWAGMSAYNPHLNPIIRHCSFDNTNDGCLFYIWGWYIGSNAPVSFGHTSPEITHCIFKNMNGTALNLTIGDRAGSSYPIFKNNLVVNCNTALISQNPYDTEIKNNIFINNNIVLKKSGALTTNVGYNSFYNNDSTDFIGFPPAYGSIVMTNHNDDPCDIGFNIFSDPLFENSTSYSLSENSPCIDAGDPNDLYDPDSTIIDQGPDFYDQRLAILLINREELDFGTVKTGKSKPDSILISNEGEKDLIINSIYTSGNDSTAFIPDVSEIIVKPGESYILLIYFNPARVDSFGTKLIIISNGGTKEVILKGRGLQGNRAPYVTNALPDTTITGSENRLVIVDDLNQIFSDPDTLDLLQFDAFSDNPDIQPITNNDSLIININQHFNNYCSVIVKAMDQDSLCAYDTMRIDLITGLENFISSIPKKLELYQNYPNPFNPVTYIYFSLPHIGKIKLEVFNNLGKKVATLIDDIKPAGNYKIEFNGNNFASGIYYYRFVTNKFVKVKKMILIK